MTTAASSVQPIFSRVGSSPGMPWMEFNSVRRTAAFSSFSFGMEQWNVPADGRSVWTHLAVKSSGDGA